MGEGVGYNATGVGKSEGDIWKKLTAEGNIA
jgi:hypothetical protein